MQLFASATAEQTASYPATGQPWNGAAIVRINGQTTERTVGPVRSIQPIIIDCIVSPLTGFLVGPTKRLRNYRNVYYGI